MIACIPSWPYIFLGAKDGPELLSLLPSPVFTGIAAGTCRISKPGFVCVRQILPALRVFSENTRIPLQTTIKPSQYSAGMDFNSHFPGV